MRKIFVWLIPVIIVMTISVGIVVMLFIKVNQNNAPVYANNIVCKYDSLTLTKNSTYTFTNDDFVIEPVNCNQKILISCDNNDLLEINSSTGEVLAKAVGNCNLVVAIKTGETTIKQIRVPIQIVNPTLPGKIVKEITLNFSTSKTYEIIEFIPTDIFANYSSTIIEGENHISILDFEHGKITVGILSAGSAKICLENLTEKVIYTVNIQ